MRDYNGRNRESLVSTKSFPFMEKINEFFENFYLKEFSKKGMNFFENFYL